MELNVIWKHARTAALECCEGSVYEMEEPCRISLNGVFYKESRQVVNLLQGLEPGKEYHVSVERGEEAAEIMFCTDTQDYTLNVRDFGAKGDGVQDDTTYIQAAIMSCPRNSRVLIPEGTYRVTSLFLKDHTRSCRTTNLFCIQPPVFPGSISINCTFSANRHILYADSIHDSGKHILGFSFPGSENIFVFLILTLVSSP